jgi:S-adenosyl-l-methionine hydroxide adenosyltransferase
MIALFTDFGLHGPYTGQMKAVLHQMAPGIPAIDLFADAPVGNPKASAYLLAAYAGWFPAGIVFLCVVDPGVGGARPMSIFQRLSALVAEPNWLKNRLYLANVTMPLKASEDHAIKEMIAEQLAAAMEEEGITKVEMAARMKTSRRQLDRLFDPAIPSVTLDTLRRAATALGRSLRIELV